MTPSYHLFLFPDHLVTWQLLARAYGFMGMLESFAAFFMYFWYMASYGGMYPSDLILLYDGVSLV